MTVQPVKPVEPVKPLSPQRARARADKLNAAQQKLTDLKKQNDIRVQAQKRKLADI